MEKQGSTSKQPQQAAKIPDQNPSPNPSMKPADHLEPQKLMKSFDKKQKSWMFPVMAAVIILAGIGTGYSLSGAKASSNSSKKSTDTAEVTQQNTLAAETGEAVDDDEAPIGVLVEGGSEGEGTHRLDRGLGPEKDVYLLSTVLTLDNFVGKKVQIWGKDLGAKEVGWLMDVTKIRILE